MSRTCGTRAVLVAVVATVALGACGSGSTAASGRPASGEVAVGGTAGGKGVRAHATAYARCMRRHGVDFPDPTFDRDGRPQFDSSGGTVSGAATDGSVDEAREACETTWPGMEGRYPRSPAELRRLRTALLAYAACMRGHGVDFPDPTFDRTGRPVLEHHGDAADGAGGHDATFNAAVQACRDQMGDRPVMGSAGGR